MSISGKTKQMGASSVIVEKLKSFLENKSGNFEEIPFQSAGFLTLGVEVELQLIDLETLDLTPRADEIIKEFGDNDRVTQELFQSMIEIRTSKCTNVFDVETDLSLPMKRLFHIGDKIGVAFSGTGCHPFAEYSERVVSDVQRCKDLIDRNQWIARRLSICGLHVYIGMKNGDDCIVYMNFLKNFLPHFLALSASSPYWRGVDTGLSTCRPTMFEAMPTAGHPFDVYDWKHFEYLVHTLKECKAIRDIKDLWWDIRPSPKFGTLEIRVCDGTATLDEILAITAYIQLLCSWFENNRDVFVHQPEWLYRENKWRVMRSGLDADIVLDERGTHRPVKVDILSWIGKLQTYSEMKGYQDHMNMLRTILEKGNSSQRQKEIFLRSGSLKEVIRHNINECKSEKPNFPEPVTEEN